MVARHRIPECLMKMASSPLDLATAADDHFQSPALVVKSGTTYLIATLLDTTAGNRYNDCWV